MTFCNINLIGINKVIWNQVELIFLKVFIAWTFYVSCTQILLWTILKLSFTDIFKAQWKEVLQALDEKACWIEEHQNYKATEYVEIT